MNSDFLMDSHCFACGVDNHRGLQLKISRTSNGVEARIIPPPWVQSYKDTVHGGIIATILDEMAVWAAFKRGYKCVTAELNMRILHTMPLKGTYTARAHVVSTKHRLVQTDSEITNAENEIIARAHAKLMRID